MTKKSILFISALDFKEKSIQVIRKTPEAYYKAGWDVYYVVARDTSKDDNYFYEKEINPEGLEIDRFYIPFARLHESMKNRLFKLTVAKFRYYITIIQLAFHALKILKHKNIDVIYGYEHNGVLAVNLLRLLGKLPDIKIVSRFQGTFKIKSIIQNKNFFKGLLQWDKILALYLPANLCIITNDGTQGDEVLKKIKSRNYKNFKFWVNGVDEQKLSPEKIADIKNEYGISDIKTVLLTICRLQDWKRVDRGIHLLAKLIHDYELQSIKYYIVGEGNKRKSLESLAQKLKIEQCIEFTGSIRNENVKKYLNIADIFISTYDFSNVGNPLLEAIRANKIIFTLNNGDTHKWIQHENNGFIYNIEDNLIDNMAKDMNKLISNIELKEKIIVNIKQTEIEKLWTWEERFNAEIEAINHIL